MKKRTAVSLLAAGLLVALLSSCGDGKKESASDAAPITLKVYAQDYTPGVNRSFAALPPLKEFSVLAEKYHELHPNVTLEFVELPTMKSEEEYQSWVVTQTLAGTIPEIVYAQATSLEAYAKNDWFVDLYPYLSQPNPYVAGNEHWMDLFGEKLISTRRAAGGQLWSLPISMVATAIFYNKDIFDSVGVTPPKTWAEFMSVCQKLKTAGKTPMLFDMSNTTHLSWSYRVILSYFYESVLPEIDVLPADDIISTEEFARAVKKGLIDANSERHKEIFRLYNQWKDYYQKGFLSAPAPGMFERGEVAMWWQGIWQLLPLEMDPGRKFEYGTFYMPKITGETSGFVEGDTPVRMIGGASGIQFAISKAAKDKNVVEPAVDFLKFITTPENDGAIFAEGKTLAPIVKGAKGDPALDSFVAQGENGITTFVLERLLNTQQRDAWLRIMSLYLSGKYDLDKVSSEMQKLYMEAADIMIAANKYDQSRW